VKEKQTKEDRQKERKYYRKNQTNKGRQKERKEGRNKETKVEFRKFI
jgi:hypothetical protein